jgi:hypothetical protein
MAYYRHTPWSAAEWRQAADRLAECADLMSDPQLRRHFEELAADALKTAGELDRA